jgi:hypothetical protein
MKRQWIKFTTDTGLVCGYNVEEGEYRIKIFTSLPRRFYYSAYNEAGEYFEEFIKPKI